MKLTKEEVGLLYMLTYGAIKSPSFRDLPILVKEQLADLLIKFSNEARK